MYRGDYILPEEEFNNMIYDLKNISYNANKVDLFIPGKSVTNNLGERKLPPEIYSIK